MCPPRRTLSIFDCVEQTFARQLAVLRLRARILYRDADSAWPVSKRHGGGDLVYVLSTRAAGARENFLQIDLANTEPRQAFGK